MSSALYLTILVNPVEGAADALLVHANAPQAAKGAANVAERFEV
jgi:hypothetical protein